VWTALGGGGEPPSARESMGFVATSDGRLWVYGGYHESALGDLRSYDPDSGNWTLARDRGLLDIQIARYGMGMTAGPGAFLYVFGGSDGSSRLGLARSRPGWVGGTCWDSCLRCRSPPNSGGVLVLLARGGSSCVWASASSIVYALAYLVWNERGLQGQH